MEPLLKWVQKNYNDPEIVITENGLLNTDAGLEDDDRLYVIKASLNI